MTTPILKAPVNSGLMNVRTRSDGGIDLDVLGSSLWKSLARIVSDTVSRNSWCTCQWPSLPIFLMYSFIFAFCLFSQWNRTKVPLHYSSSVHPRRIWLLLISWIHVQFNFRQCTVMISQVLSNTAKYHRQRQEFRYTTLAYRQTTEISLKNFVFPTTKRSRDYCRGKSMMLFSNCCRIARSTMILYNFVNDLSQPTTPKDDRVEVPPPTHPTQAQATR